ncbi:DNA polymerase III subunit gamma and tau, partial [Thermomonospora catenispora]
RQRPAARPPAASAPAPAARPAPAAASGGGPDMATIQRAWPNIVEGVKRKSKVAWMVIMSGVQPLSLEGNLLTLAFEGEGARTNFTNGNRDVVLREVLRETLGVDLRIDTVLAGTPQAAARASAAPAASPRPRLAAAQPPPPERPSAAHQPPEPPPPPPPEPPPPPVPIDETDEVDPEGDATMDDHEAAISGVELIKRELGGQVIREIDNS